MVNGNDHGRRDDVGDGDRGRSTFWLKLILKRLNDRAPYPRIVVLVLKWFSCMYVGGGIDCSSGAAVSVPSKISFR